MDRFALDFDNLPRQSPEHDDYRVLVSTRTLVPGFSIVGHLATDDTAEVRSTRHRHRTRLTDRQVEDPIDNDSVERA